MKKVEIFEDENSIVVEDNYSVTDFEFFPEEKKFKVSTSIKDDCFYNNQVMEYKISNDPIEMYIRTLESSHEPPLEYSIKDGVVLESRLKERDYIFPDRIEELKKEVEWSKVEMFGHYQINLYILSKHPEIISASEYRKFLRQAIERLKIGVLKVKEAVHVDKNGLEIQTGKYGNSIWYPKDILNSEDIKKLHELSEDERVKTKHGKMIAYVEKFNNDLFSEVSSEFVGISKDEFEKSSELLEYVEKLLDSKEENMSIKKDDTLTQTTNVNMIINSLVYLITILLVVLKLTEDIDWSWIGVFAPILVWEGRGFIVGFLRAFSK